MFVMDVSKWTKAERIDYARRLERIERLKAEKNRLANLKQNADSPKLDNRGRTDEIVAHKLGIGGKDTYRKEKFIFDNRSTLSPEDFADWDEDKYYPMHSLQAGKISVSKSGDIIITVTQI